MGGAIVGLPDEIKVRLDVRDDDSLEVQLAPASVVVRTSTTWAFRVAEGQDPSGLHVSVAPGLHGYTIGRGVEPDPEEVERLARDMRAHAYLLGPPEPGTPEQREREGREDEE